MDFDGLALHQHRLESLDAQTVQRGSAVQKHGMVLDDFFKNIPDHRFLALHHFFRRLDGGAVARLFQAVIDEGLEELERHLLGQTALMQFLLRPHDDHGAAGVVDAFSQQVLAEASLLAFQRVRQGLERAVIGAAQHAAPPAVVKQRVHGFLQHALFVADDHIRRMQLHQLLEAVVAIDNAAIEVIQIGSRKAPAIEGHQGPQFGRDHRDHVENHPLRFIPRLAERIQHLQPLGVLHPLLLRRVDSSFSRANHPPASRYPPASAVP